jgi:hypothetical protein
MEATADGRQTAREHMAPACLARAAHVPCHQDYVGQREVLHLSWPIGETKAGKLVTSRQHTVTGTAGALQPQRVPRSSATVGVVLPTGDGPSRPGVAARLSTAIATEL